MYVIFLLFFLRYHERPQRRSQYIHHTYFAKSTRLNYDEPE